MVETQVNSQEITTRTAKLWLGDDGIIRKVFLKKALTTAIGLIPG